MRNDEWIGDIYISAYDDGMTMMYIDGEIEYIHILMSKYTWMHKVTVSGKRNDD